VTNKATLAHVSVATVGTRKMAQSVRLCFELSGASHGGVLCHQNQILFAVGDTRADVGSFGLQEMLNRQVAAE
jgi:hypothetical protein